MKLPSEVEPEASRATTLISTSVCRSVTVVRGRVRVRARATATATATARVRARARARVRARARARVRVSLQVRDGGEGGAASGGRRPPG